MNLRTISFLFFATIPLMANAQKGLTGFPELLMADIPGAPKLGMPELVTGAYNIVVSRGHGLAAPAYYDWNADGIKDLLIGEFGSGLEHGRYVGNFIRVYLNVGTETKPEFDGRWDYARPPFQYRVQSHGAPYSVDEYCCMGITPQFIDLDEDGYTDMITGHWQGEVSWFRGSAEGFFPGQPLQQEGNPRDPDKSNFYKNQHYWIYSSSSFGDFTGDGKPDLVVGGRALRLSENIGTGGQPKFAQRELLLDIHGAPLSVYHYTRQELARFEAMEKSLLREYKSPEGGDINLSPFVTDWDRDGVLDLLVTNSYSHEGLAPITFFKGATLGGQPRFHTGVPLFTATRGGKAIPGSSPRIFVTDWNGDGVSDLLVGASVATIHGKFDDFLSWNWEDETGILAAGKDPANRNEERLTSDELKRYRENVKPPEGISIDDYMTLRHVGYIYVMLGRNEHKSR